MTKYHLGKNGPSPCKAKKRCPLGGPSEHFKTQTEASQAYEKRMNSLTIPPAREKQPESITNILVAAGDGKYPEPILRQLGEYLETRPYKPLAVIPAGSQLYGSEVPGRAVHDYDFTVFATPHSSLKKPKQHLAGELDVHSIGVDRVQELARRSAPIREAFYAMRAGRALASFDDPQWGSYFNSINLPVGQYYDLLDDCVRSTSHEYTEPVSQEEKNNFHNFKHSLRWQIYMKRWGSEGSDEFDPRFTEEEQALYRRALSEGSAKVVWE